MENHYNYLKSNMTQKNKILRRKILTEIKNYERRYTIYKLVCNITNDTYYGSTCQRLSARLWAHKHTNKCSSRIIIDRGNYSALIPLESNLSYSKKMEREDYYIRNNVCINKKGATRNQELKRDLTKWRNQNKEYTKNYNYWIKSHPLGILARAYF